MSDLFSSPNLRDERVVIDDPDSLDTRPLAGVGGHHDLKMVRMKAVTSENPFHSHFSDSVLKRLKALMANDALEWANDQAVADALLLNAVKAADGLDRHWSYIYELAALVRDSELFRAGAEGSGFASSPAETFDAWWETNMRAPFAKFKEFEKTYHLAARFGISVEGLSVKEAQDLAISRGDLAEAAELQAEHGRPAHRPVTAGMDAVSSNIVTALPLKRTAGNNALQLYREVKRAASDGDALAKELLEKLDRKEIKPAAAARQLGLRRPQITVPLKPELDARLRKVVAAEETTIREVTEMALERFLDWLEQAEEDSEGELRAPEPAPVFIDVDGGEPQRAPAPAAAGIKEGDLVTGTRVGELLGHSKAFSAAVYRKAQEKGLTVATIDRQGWGFTRNLKGEETRWRVVKVPA